MMTANRIIEDTRKHWEDVLDIQMFHLDDIHLSVSRTQPLRHHWIQEFVDNLRHAAKGINR